jgi:hypothetical protein
MEYYTYLWLRENGSPYYAGKGRGSRGFESDGHRVKRPPTRDRIIIQYWDSEEEAFEAEVFLIDYYGRKDLGTGCLTNLTAGGIGGVNKWSLENGRRVGSKYGAIQGKKNVENGMIFELGKIYGPIFGPIQGQKAKESGQAYRAGKEQGRKASESGQIQELARIYGPIYGKIYGPIQGRKNAESGHLKKILWERWHPQHISRGIVKEKCPFCCEEKI